MLAKKYIYLFIVMSEKSPPVMPKAFGKVVFTKRIYFFLDQREKEKKKIIRVKEK